MLDVEISKSPVTDRLTSDRSDEPIFRQAVVAVHGLAAHRLAMWPILRRLERVGFLAENFGYWSVGSEIRDVAEGLKAVLSRLDAAPSIGRIHLVTHSMGGIVARDLFRRFHLKKLHRIVMLAPPNRGSHVAGKLAPAATWLLPALRQLTDCDESYVNQLGWEFGENRVDLGVIAARYDRVIQPHAVPHPAQKEMVTVDANHGPLPWKKETIELVESFLVRGTFFRPVQGNV